jgi:hypothetical protein
VFCQAPVLLQVWGCWPLHWIAPGEHDPEHAPETHAWLVHATGLPQVPMLPQV